ncbi:MAG TPA: methyltransferase domain-containing protein [Vicinamibacterales bacterium]|nr:methyltransferase domain-containing protein [Vicinamibacterales bacterium]
MIQITLLLAAISLAAPAYAQSDDYARQVAQERKAAEAEAPQLAEVLGVKPGMVVADIGTGGGAMSIVLARLVGSGRIYATDVTERALTTTRAYAKKEGLTNITVIEGGVASTNLPDSCCDALFMRNVYHHITEPAAFNKSLLASAKPGARLAIIDFEDRRGGKIPEGVPANRGGHGIPPGIVIQELTAAGFVHVRTIDAWPPEAPRPAPFLALFEKK